MKPFVIGVAFAFAIPNGFLAALIVKAAWEQHRAQRSHSCPTCDRLRHPSAAIEQHPYLVWLEAPYRWEVESR